MIQAFALMLVLWLVQLRTRNAAVVDLGWTACLGWLHAREALNGWPPRSALLAGMVVLWALRLGIHLFRARVWRQSEEGRYVDLRGQWGAQADRNLLAFFWLQAALAGLLAAPYRVVYQNSLPGWSMWELLGLGLFCLGWAGETLADQQLAAFKADPRNAGQVCQAGLWNYSRHPNYFFELLMWTAWSVYALGSPGGWWAFLSPAILLYSVLFVTGIPPTEAQALRSRGEAYRRYQQTTSALIPWFKRC